MKIINHNDGENTLKAVWGDRFAKGKIRIAWSQTRGGIATWVSGRMEGELHDTEEQAAEWLEKVGVERSRFESKKKKLTKRQLNTLNRAHEVLNAIDGELYEDLLDAGCEPCTALHSLGEIIRELS